MRAPTLESLLDLLYLKRCPLCDLLAPVSPCERCLSEFEQADSVFRPEYGFLDHVSVLYRYTGRAAQAVRELKYSRSTSLVSTMAARMAERFAEIGGDVDAVVPVPIHWSRRCQRGFNQSELLCEAMPRKIVRPRLLVRSRATRPQVGLTHEERLVNLQGAFRAGGVSGLRILLVDDVLTTGGTARECAKALRQAGAVDIGFLAFAGE